MWTEQYRWGFPMLQILPGQFQLRSLQLRKSIIFSGASLSCSKRLSCGRIVLSLMKSRRICFADQLYKCPSGQHDSRPYSKYSLCICGKHLSLHPSLPAECHYLWLHRQCSVLDMRLILPHFRRLHQHLAQPRTLTNCKFAIAIWSRAFPLAQSWVLPIFATLLCPPSIRVFFLACLRLHNNLAKMLRTKGGGDYRSPVTPLLQQTDLNRWALIFHVAIFKRHLWYFCNVLSNYQQWFSR